MRQLTVVDGGEARSHTDGETLWVSSALAPRQAAASVVVQAALIRAGTFEAATLYRVLSRPGLKSRFLTLEVVRSVLKISDVVPAWVSAAVLEVWGGPVPESPAISLAWAGSRARHVPEAPEFFGAIKPMLVLRRHPTGTSGVTADELQGSREESMRETTDDEETAPLKAAKWLSAPVRNPLAEMLLKMLGGGRAPGAGGGQGAEMPIGGTHSMAEPRPGARPTAGIAPLPLTPGLSLSIGFAYPEWDCNRRMYRPEHCRVVEVDPTTASDGAVDRSEWRDDRLRSQLATLGRSTQRHRRQEEGESLDLTALMDLAVEQRAGGTPDPRVYEARRRTARDLGVVVLLDSTGSTGESVASRRVFDQQRVTAARLTRAFFELGVRVATFGFYSQAQMVRFLRVKDFDDRFDRGSEERLAQLRPGGFTRLGAAVRHASHLLEHHSGARERLLIVIGDGLPYDDGYEHRYAREDCRVALIEAVRRGNGCVGLSVSSAVDPELTSEVWGDIPHAGLDRPDQLVRVGRSLFTRALVAAGAARRDISGPRSQDADS